MVIGRARWVLPEFETLRLSAEWESRWKPALDEDRAGLPTPFRGYSRSSATLIHHAYHIFRFEAATGRKISDFETVVEFGGGYGSMLRLIERLGFSGKYHIHDLPELGALQRFFHESVRAEGWTGGAGGQRLTASFSSRREDALRELSDPESTLFIATWSLSETPLEVREEWRPTLARFSWFLIGFQEVFEGMNNRAWFAELTASRPDVRWCLEPILHRPDPRFYLFGCPDGDTGP